MKFNKVCFVRSRQRYFGLFSYCLLQIVTVMIFLCANNLSAKEKENSVETLSDVSIIGNSELPSINFNLPWRLPSIEKRGEESPPKDISDVLTPLEPRRNRQRIHFSHFLEVDAPHFQAR